MRPVARIAQSVEQGIENPRVLGSIPSPGTTIQRTQPMAGFLLFCGRTLHRTPFDYSPHDSLHLQDIGWKLAYQKLYPKQHAKSGQNDDTSDIQKQAGTHHLLLLDMAGGENDSVWRRRHGQHKSA